MLFVKCEESIKKQVATALKVCLLDRCENVNNFEDGLAISEEDDGLKVVIPEDDVYGDIDSYPWNVSEALKKVKKQFPSIAVDGSCWVTSYQYGYSLGKQYHCEASDKKITAEDVFACISCGELFTEKNILVKAKEDRLCICAKKCAQEIIDAEIEYEDIEAFIDEEDEAYEDLDEEEAVEAFKEQLKSML